MFWGFRPWLDTLSLSLSLFYFLFLFGKKRYFIKELKRIHQSNLKYRRRESGFVTIEKSKILKISKLGHRVSHIFYCSSYLTKEQELKSILGALTSQLRELILQW